MASDTLNAFMLEVVTKDAAAWYKRGHGAVYKRDPLTEKSLDAKTRRAHDELFDGQRREADASLMAWYEERVLAYGGDVDELPWHKRPKKERTGGGAD